MWEPLGQAPGPHDDQGRGRPHGPGTPSPVGQAAPGGTRQRGGQDYGGAHGPHLGGQEEGQDHKRAQVKKAKSKPETHESGQDLKPKKMPVKKAGGSMPPPEPAEGPRTPMTPPDLLLEADRKRQRVSKPEPERATPTEAATQRSEASSSKDKEFVRRWKEREERSASRTSPLTSLA